MLEPCCAPAGRLKRLHPIHTFHRGYQYFAPMEQCSTLNSSFYGELKETKFLFTIDYSLLAIQYLCNMLHLHFTFLPFQNSFQMH